MSTKNQITVWTEKMFIVYMNIASVCIMWWKNIIVTTSEKDQKYWKTFEPKTVWYDVK